MENNQKQIKVINYTWWLFMILGIIIGLAKSDSRYIYSAPSTYALIGASNGLVFGALIGYLIDQIRKSSVVQKVAKNIEEQKTERELNRNVQNSLNAYKDSVHSFQYLSNQTLLDKFQNEQQDKDDNMVRLALEEEMVKRGLIEYSPTHEKIDKLKDYFK